MTEVQNVLELVQCVASCCRTPRTKTLHTTDLIVLEFDSQEQNEPIEICQVKRVFLFMEFGEFAESDVDYAEGTYGTSSTTNPVTQTQNRLKSNRGPGVNELESLFTPRAPSRSRPKYLDLNRQKINNHSS